MRWAVAIDFGINSPMRKVQQYVDQGMIVDSVEEMETNIKAVSRGLAEHQTRPASKSGVKGGVKGADYQASRRKGGIRPPEDDVLITIDRTQTVQFIHQSVIDFLLSDDLRSLFETAWQSLDHVVGTAHYHLARTCLRYLSYEDLDNIRPTIEITEIRDKFIFLPYALTAWTIHCQESL